MDQLSSTGLIVIFSSLPLFYVNVWDAGTIDPKELKASMQRWKWFH